MCKFRYGYSHLTCLKCKSWAYKLFDEYSKWRRAISSPFFIHYSVTSKHVNFEKFTVLAPVFAHSVISHIRILHVKCKIIGKVKMETTIAVRINSNYIKRYKMFSNLSLFWRNWYKHSKIENFQNKIFPLFILRTIQSMHARYQRTLQHLLTIEGWFVYTLFSLKC
jgi:hypothetical protein